MPSSRALVWNEHKLPLHEFELHLPIPFSMLLTVIPVTPSKALYVANAHIYALNMYQINKYMLALCVDISKRNTKATMGCYKKLLPWKIRNLQQLKWGDKNSQYPALCFNTCSIPSDLFTKYWHLMVYIWHEFGEIHENKWKNYDSHFYKTAILRSASLMYHLWSETEYRLESVVG